MQPDLLLASRFPVQIGSADAGDQAFITQHIGPPLDLALSGQLGDVARHSRTGYADQVRQILLADKWIVPDVVQNLLFFVHGLPPFRVMISSNAYKQKFIIQTIVFKAFEKEKPGSPGFYIGCSLTASAFFSL